MDSNDKTKKRRLLDDKINDDHDNNDDNQQQSDDNSENNSDDQKTEEEQTTAVSKEEALKGLKSYLLYMKRNSPLSESQERFIHLKDNECGDGKETQKTLKKIGIKSAKEASIYYSLMDILKKQISKEYSFSICASVALQNLEFIDFLNKGY